jgi:hypothetical protein
MHVSAFLGSDKNHGGVRRSKQLARLSGLAEKDIISLQNFQRKKLFHWMAYPFATIRILPVVLELGLTCLSFKGVVALLVYVVPLYASIMVKRNGSPVGLEICANIGVLVGNVFASLGIPFNAYPHNIEFLVPGQKQSFFRGPLSEYRAERRVYRHALKVVAISRYDASVISSLGIPSVELIDYFPTEDDCPFWDCISSARLSSSKSFFLILGTASNPPTRLGLQKLLCLIEQDPVSSSRKFVLAGFGTASLKDQIPSSVELAGEVSDDALQALMINAKGLVLWQPPTSGMLTRLVEACQAGIPCFVFGGYHQALEMRGSDVFQVSSLVELPD